MLTMAYIESRFNPKAFNTGSKAAGLYQFIPSTARAYNLSDPFNATLSSDAAARLALDNAKYLVSNKLSVCGENLYLAHQQGMGGSVAILKAAKRNLEVPVKIRTNMNSNGGRGLTPAQFVAKWEAKYQQAVVSAFNLARTVRPNL
jgi:hypothetical protein